MKGKKWLSALLVLLLLPMLAPGPVRAGEAERDVFLGGRTVGIALYTEGLVVTDLAELTSGENKTCPGREAGLKKGDVLLSADGVFLENEAALERVLNASDGRSLRVRFSRDGTEAETLLAPLKTADGYKAGLWLRDSCAGVGTVTFVCPENMAFAALGHAISEDGHAIPCRAGRLIECRVHGVVKGENGEAGELKSSFGVDSRILGKITQNGRFGLSGTVTEWQGEKIPLGSREDVHPGEAFLVSDFSGTLKRYRIRILYAFRQNKPGEKGMIVKVTDPELLNATGGIVQGLSGSPIVQEGKLVGAVTHVMLGDPTRGWGVYIDWMMG